MCYVLLVTNVIVILATKALAVYVKASPVLLRINSHTVMIDTDEKI